MNHFVTILMVAVAERETSSQLIPNENDHLCLITVQCCGSLVRDRILNCHNTQLGRRINQDPLVQEFGVKSEVSLMPSHHESFMQGRRKCLNTNQ